MKQGFTLIELLVVVTIIGILSSIALPQYRRIVNKARLSEAVSHMGDLKRAIDIYKMQYPTESATFLSGNTRLDIDLHGALTCQGDVCSSKSFTYQASCTSSTCTITIAPTGTFAAHLPTLTATRTKSGVTVTWAQTCTPPADSNICDSLESDGYSIGS